MGQMKPQVEGANIWNAWANSSNRDALVETIDFFFLIFSLPEVSFSSLNSQMWYRKMKQHGSLETKVAKFLEMISPFLTKLIHN